MQFLDEESSKEDGTFSNSDWGQEAAMAMCEEVKDFPIISGGDTKLTLQYLMDLTPKDQISKVMLEEKVFETWCSGRTVLVGDGMLCISWLITEAARLLYERSCYPF